MAPYILIAFFTILAGAYVLAVLQNFGLPFLAALGAGVLTMIMVFSVLKTFGKHIHRSGNNLPYKGS